MSGPGTQLKGIFQSLGITFSPDCPCEEHARQMDEWGVDGCRLHFTEIVNWLKDGVDSFGWGKRFQAAALAVVSGVAFEVNWLDPFPGIVLKAIEMAEQDHDFGMGCVCPMKGFCEHYGRQMSAREVQICRGNDITPEKRQLYVAQWEQGESVQATDLRRNVPAGSVQKPKAIPPRARCEHLGLFVRSQSVPTCCGGSRDVTVYECRKFGGECQLGVRLPGVRSCSQPCEGYSSPKPQKKTTPFTQKPIDRSRLVKHLLYHLMPLAGDSEYVWRRHARWICEISSQFNGRIIVTVVKPAKGEPNKYNTVSEVRQALDGSGAEIIEAINDYKTDKRFCLGEAATYRRMLELIKTDDPDEVFFYGHTKGVTRPLDRIPQLWSEVMFETILNNHEEVIDVLDEKALACSFLMPGGHQDGQAGLGFRWFPSGTVFAVRSAAVFAKRGWRHVPEHYGGVEQWPNRNFDQHTEVKCVFWPNSNNLYDETYWETQVLPAYEQWKADHDRHQATVGSHNETARPAHGVGVGIV